MAKSAVEYLKNKNNKDENEEKEENSLDSFFKDSSEEDEKVDITSNDKEEEKEESSLEPSEEDVKVWDNVPSTLEAFITNAITCVSPATTFGFKSVEAGFGLDVLGHLFSEREWLVDDEDRMKWKTTDLSKNTAFQLAPSAIYALTRTLVPDNLLANRVAASLFAVSRIAENINSGRGVFDYGRGSKFDFMNLLSDLSILGFEFIRPAIREKFNNKSNKLKTIDAVGNLITGETTSRASNSPYRPQNRI